MEELLLIHSHKPPVLTSRKNRIKKKSCRVIDWISSQMDKIIPVFPLLGEEIKAFRKKWKILDFKTNFFASVIFTIMIILLWNYHITKYTKSLHLRKIPSCKNIKLNFNFSLILFHHMRLSAKTEEMLWFKHLIDK